MQEDSNSTISLFGISIVNMEMNGALDLLEKYLLSEAKKVNTVMFVNTSTLNLVIEDSSFRDIVKSADTIFGDGTGVRWASRFLRGVQLKDNLNGTDMIPLLMTSRGKGVGYRYYLLGGTRKTNQKAAIAVRDLFPDWTLVGHHHGYVTSRESRAIVEEVNASAAHLLLVGMGSPVQERWIYTHIDRLRIPLCIGVGGLFSYWSGELTRAAQWLRFLGYEWVHLLVKQPRKITRYLIGNPKFLMRLVKTKYS
jgi:N-acetylglucosaminyldiphosphoundecaprenol N-acetyl-beta-D-mannosaminyltransferase